MTMQGKSAIVTGSTSGIGLAIATALAREGCDLMLNGLGDAGEIEATRAKLAADTGRTVRFSPANMMHPDEVTAMVREAESTFGKVDVVVSNAGIQHVSPVEEFPVDRWDAIIAINLCAAFHLTRAVVPGMKARRHGRLVNIASAHSLVASPFKSAYVAAKHGLAGFTKTIALELATFGITANCISPGYVWTPLVERQIPDTMKARNLTREQVMNDVLLAAQPTKQFVQTAEVAALVLYLCSDAAKNITGANSVIDGGWTAA